MQVEVEVKLEGAQYNGGRDVWTSVCMAGRALGAGQGSVVQGRGRALHDAL